MKKMLSVVLSFLLILSLMPLGMPVQAAGGKLMAVTYDDGPGPYTERLLDGLAARGVKATFFMQGMNVERYPATVARMYREGHQIANHTYNHPMLTGLSYASIASQVFGTNDILRRASGCGAGTDFLLRPPYGDYNSNVAGCVGTPLVMWSIDPLDWKYRNAYTVRSNILNNAHDGAVLLLHDIHSTTVDGSLSAIDALAAQGYEFVTVRELFRRRGRDMAAGYVYNQCNPNGTDLGPIAQPEITAEPKGGLWQVSITAQEGVPIYYSVDGSALNQESALYTGPFTVHTPCTVRACAAYNMNGSRSGTVERFFERPVAPTPVLHVADGMLTIDGYNLDTWVNYSISGAQDSGGNQIYTGPVPVAPGTRIAAYAEGEGYFNSDVARITYSPLGNVFRDVFPDDWFFEYVDTAAHLRIMLGVGDGYFAPQETVTRGQLVTLLYRMACTFGEYADVKYELHIPYSDVPVDAYYARAVAWAAEKGVVSGYTDGTFRPDQAVTREELAAISSRYIECMGIGLAPGPIEGFTDHAAISDWAAEGVGKLSAAGLLQGDDEGYFRPDFYCTRGETAVSLVRLYNFLTPQLVVPSFEG